MAGAVARARRVALTTSTRAAGRGDYPPLFRGSRDSDPDRPDLVTSPTCLANAVVFICPRPPCSLLTAVQHRAALKYGLGDPVCCLGTPRQPPLGPGSEFPEGPLQGAGSLRVSWPGNAKMNFI